MPGELCFIQRYDEARRELQNNIVDMADKYLTLMITFLHQNKGVFPKGGVNSFQNLPMMKLLQCKQDSGKFLS